MKVPRQCPLVLLVKMGWRGGIYERWSRVPLHSIKPRVQTLNLGKAAYGEILIFIWGRLLRAKIFMLMLAGLHERHTVSSSK
jgi:hypothetical protein